VVDSIVVSEAEVDASLVIVIGCVEAIASVDINVVTAIVVEV
jgi:hypothetical protein